MDVFKPKYGHGRIFTLLKHLYPQGLEPEMKIESVPRPDPGISLEELNDLDKLFNEVNDEEKREEYSDGHH